MIDAAPGLLAVMLAVSVHAEDVLTEGEKIDIVIDRINDQGVGESIGTITASSTPYGTLFTPRLSGLAPGMHGFHLHENPACGPGMDDGKKKAGLAAGGHFDPEVTNKHMGPFNKDGHLGDLPALYFDKDEKATMPVLAPRIMLAELRGHALVIHAGGDTYRPEPKLGGGGARVACGVVPRP